MKKSPSALGGDFFVFFLFVPKIISIFEAIKQKRMPMKQTRRKAH